MNNKLFFIAIFAGIMLLPGCKTKYEYPFQDLDLSVDERIENLLGLLTLEEKAGMMVNSSEAVPRLGIPAYDWWNEALHGVGRAGLATVYPQAIGMAATWNEPGHLEAFMKRCETKTGEGITDSVFGLPISIFSVTRAGEEDRRPMARILFSLHDWVWQR